ncbi:MAG: hypothetical protein ACUZ8O_10650 [Candidatus Anammoxibacter sp.]
MTIDILPCHKTVENDIGNMEVMTERGKVLDAAIYFLDKKQSLLYKTQTYRMKNKCCLAN